MKITLNIPENVVKKAACMVMANDDSNVLPSDFVEQALATESMDLILPSVMSIKDAHELYLGIALCAIGTMAAKIVEHG